MTETAVATPSAAGARRAEQLARAWLTTLTVSDGAGPADLDLTAGDGSARAAFLTDQSALLLAILLGDPFQPTRAASVGQALVRAGFVAADVLGRSLRVLILRVPRMLSDGMITSAAAGDMERRVAEVSEALANGYVQALRDRALAEQESAMRAELDEQRVISEQLRHQATHDPLTGLANRTAVFGRLAAALEPERGNRVGLCYLDLDDFKLVNDQHGHQAGDELLVTVARRIEIAARRHGVLAGRIGGDEFVVVAEVSPGTAGLAVLAAGILSEVNRPVSVRSGAVTVRISVCAGIAECAAGSAAATLTAAADAALYQAKSRGRGRWAVHGAAHYGY
jgi:diguanylate cyclase (GGDEF)-like protein